MHLQYIGHGTDLDLDFPLLAETEYLEKLQSHIADLSITEHYVISVPLLRSCFREFV